MAITPGCIARKRTKKRHKEIRGLSEEEGRRGVADQKEQLQAAAEKRSGRSVDRHWLLSNKWYSTETDDGGTADMGKPTTGMKSQKKRENSTKQ